MSFFGSIGKFLGGAVKTVGGILGGVLGSPAQAVGLPSNVLGWGGPPAMPGGAQIIGGTGIPSGGFGGLPSRGGGFLQTAGQFLQAQGFGPSLGAIAGGVPGTGGIRKMKRGRLTGNAIPVGFQERMSKQGVIYLAKATRRRGITGRDLSAFRRVSRLISSYHRAPATFHRRRRAS